MAKRTTTQTGTNTMSATAFFKSATAAVTVANGNDPIAKFKERLDQQIAIVAQVKEGKEIPKLTAWFKKAYDGTYTAKIGRSAFEIEGIKNFACKDLDAVEELFTQAKAYVDESKAMQAAVIANAGERSERLKAARGSRKPKAK